LSPKKDPLKNKDASRAREYVFRLLKSRMRTEHEICQRLKKKNFSDNVIRQVIVYFKKLRFIDDKEFAGLWLSSRLKKPLGFRRLRFELKRKGLKNDLIEKSVNKLKKDYDETSIVRQLAIQRLKKLRDLEPITIKRRLFSYLAGRGFSLDVIIEVLRSIKQDDKIEEISEKSFLNADIRRCNADGRR